MVTDWTNENTKLVADEIINNLCPEDFDLTRGKDMGLVDLDELADALANRVMYYIHASSESGYARLFATRYFCEVDWDQLAKVFVEQYITE